MPPAQRGDRGGQLVEHHRCAQCRNPIRGRQAMVRLARADLTFHADCWAILNLNVQREYEIRAQDEGLAALLGPYHRGQTAAWLPVEAAEAAEVAGAAEAQWSEQPGGTAAGADDCRLTLADAG